MTLILLLLVHLLSADDVPIHEAEEGSSLTLTWDSPVPMDLTGLHMTCFVKKDPKKLLNYMVGGEQKYQDAQFSGRVRCDTEALRQGQVRLILTSLTPPDSGEYRCDMAANYDPDKGEWGFSIIESFRLQVTLKRPVFVTIPHADENGGRPAALRKEHDPGSAAAVVLGALVAVPVFVAGVMFAMRQFYR